MLVVVSNKNNARYIQPDWLRLPHHCHWLFDIRP